MPALRPAATLQLIAKDEDTASNVLGSADGRERLVKRIVRHAGHQEFYGEGDSDKLHSFSEKVVVEALLSNGVRVFVEPITLMAGLSGRSITFDCATNLYYEDRMMVFEYHSLRKMQKDKPLLKILKYFSKLVEVKKRHPEIYSGIHVRHASKLDKGRFWTRLSEFLRWLRLC